MRKAVSALWVALGLVLGVISSHAAAQSLPFDEAKSATRLETLIARLNHHTVLPSGGSARLAYSDADKKAREQIIREMIRLGLRIRIDAAGNIIGRRNGQSNFKDAIVIGTHIDTTSGTDTAIDGVSGIAVALDVVEVLNSRDRRTAWPIEIVVFQNAKGGLIGAKAWSGALSDTELSKQTISGYTVREGTKRIGGRLAELQSAQRSSKDVKAFVGIHIDNSGYLRKEARDIGIVTATTGSKTWDVTIAGTNEESKAEAYTEFVQLLNHSTKAFEDDSSCSLQTSASTSAAKAVMSTLKAGLQITGCSTLKIDKLFLSIKDRIPVIEEKTGSSFTLDFNPEKSFDPVGMNPRMVQLIEKKARDNDFGFRSLHANGFHEARNISRIAPAGMILVPSVVDHDKETNTSIDFKSLARGVKVLMDTVLGIDALQL